MYLIKDFKGIFFLLKSKAQFLKGTNYLMKGTF